MYISDYDEFLDAKIREWELALNKNGDLSVLSEIQKYSQGISCSLTPYGFEIRKIAPELAGVTTRHLIKELQSRPNVLFRKSSDRLESKPKGMIFLVVDDDIWNEITAENMGY